MGPIEELVITGPGDICHITCHDLRATVTTQLVLNIHNTVNVWQHLIDPQMESANAYVNILGELGTRQ